MLKIAVGVPAYRGVVSSGQFRMWMQLGAAIGRAKDQGLVDLVMMADVDVCGVGQARNLLVAYAMKEQADWLLMVDSDTWALGTDLLRMILEAPSDCAVVGAIVKTRGHHRSNVYAWDAATGKHEQLDLEPGLVGANEDPYCRVDAIGGAVMAINLRKIGSADFRWMHREDGSSISEDLYFCRQIQLPNTIAVDRRMVTWHVDRPQILRSL